MLNYPPRLTLAQTPTPFHPLTRFSEDLRGPTIWIKRDDQTGCALTGNKVRKLEFILALAREQGADTLVTCGGLQSNHCRATALLGAQLGFRVHLILRGEKPRQSDGNLLLGQLAGASIEYHTAALYGAGLPQLQLAACQRLQGEGHRPYLIPTGASDGVGIWGYIRAAAELLADIQRYNLTPRAIVCASGSGGTQAGLTLGLALAGSSVPVIGMAVCDDQALFENKIRRDIADWFERYGSDFAPDPGSLNLRIHVNDHYIGPGYAKAQPEVWDVIRQLAAREGVLLDPVYTGKAFLGMTRELQAGTWGKDGDIIFVHTGGLFGLFPQKHYL